MDLKSESKVRVRIAGVEFDVRGSFPAGEKTRAVFVFGNDGHVSAVVEGDGSIKMSTTNCWLRNTELNALRKFLEDEFLTLMPLCTNATKVA